MAEVGGSVPRGMRDLLPEDMIQRREALLAIERAYKSYGFEPVETPALEYLKVLRAKCGEEVRNQIYEIEDMGLRFEFTAGLARMTANSSLPKPFKAYQIGPVWRRDEPQKGRYRQFWQADIDIIGSQSMKCEAELLACASDALKAIGIADFTIRLNSRKTLADIITKSGIIEAGVSSEETMRSLDKLKKKGDDAVRAELLGKGAPEGAVDRLFDLISSKPSEEFAGIDELNQILDFSKAYGTENIRIDLSLARGLGYYTGPIFEIESTADLGTIAGGGRYDDLLGLFGSPSPAAGISFGVDRLMELLKLAKERKAPKSVVNIFIAVVGDEQYPYAVGVAQQLRAAGANVSLDLTDRSLKKQFEYANANGMPFVAVIGEKEAKEGKLTLRDMSSGKETLLPVGEARKVLGL